MEDDVVLLLVATAVDCLSGERAGDVRAVGVDHVFPVVGVGEVELDLAVKRVGLVVAETDGMVGVEEVAAVDVDAGVCEADDLVLSVDVVAVERLDVGARAHHFLRAVLAEKTGVGMLVGGRGVVDHAVHCDDSSLRGEEGDDERNVVCFRRYTTCEGERRRSQEETI